MRPNRTVEEEKGFLSTLWKRGGGLDGGSIIVLEPSLPLLSLGMPSGDANDEGCCCRLPSPIFFSSGCFLKVPNHQRMQKWKLSWNIYRLHTHFCTFGTDLHAQPVLVNEISASELRWKFIKSALLVGQERRG